MEDMIFVLRMFIRIMILNESTEQQLRDMGIYALPSEKAENLNCVMVCTVLLCSIVKFAYPVLLAS